MPELDGDFDDSRLRETLNEHIGVGADASQPAPVRFLRGVQRVVRMRMAVEDADNIPAVFLLNESRNIPTGARRIGMIDYGDKPLEGRVWYVGPALGFARALEHDCGYDDAALFELVVDTLGEGNTPAVVYVPNLDRTTVRHYPLGLAHEDNYQLLSVVARPVGLADVFEALDLLHQNQLITPIIQSAGNRLWKDADRYRPVHNAELVAQSYVQTTLWGRFSHCKVVVEFSQTSGRFDVALLGWESRDGVLVSCYYVVLELKVLRSYGSGGTSVTEKFNREWVEKGVDQAHAYAEELNAEAKALCCYDMRKTDTGDACFDHVADRAAKLNVALRRWYLFGPLSDYRARRSELALDALSGENDK